MRALLAALALAWAAGLSVPAHAEPAETLSSDEAHQRLAAEGELRQVTVEGDLDLRRITARAGVQALVLRDVLLRGRLRGGNAGWRGNLELERADIGGIDLRGTSWAGAIHINDTQVRGNAWFDGLSIEGSFTLQASHLLGKATFRNARFNGDATFIGTRFVEPEGAQGGVSFADARFARQARFNHVQFASTLRLDSVRFAGDASFIGLVVPGEASLRNVSFARDAEFRFCKLGDVNFGNAEQASSFAGVADFRGCRMRSLTLDFADLRGDLLLVNAHIEPGALSLRDAALRGSRNDFSGLKLADQLLLQGLHITGWNFRWRELREPLLRAQPDTAVLRTTHAQLLSHGQPDAAREVQARIDEQLLSERLEDPTLPPLERAAAWVERALWGWTTGYGSQLGRIAGLACSAWLLLSLPLWWRPGLQLARFNGKLADAPPRHLEITAEQAYPPAATRWERCSMHFAYSVALMFALPGARTRPLAPQLAQAPWLRWYLPTLRVLGAVLLALLLATLSRVSPAVQAIVGKLVL